MALACEITHERGSQWTGSKLFYGPAGLPTGLTRRSAILGRAPGCWFSYIHLWCGISCDPSSQLLDHRPGVKAEAGCGNRSGNIILQVRLYRLSVQEVRSRCPTEWLQEGSFAMMS